MEYKKNKTINDVAIYTLLCSALGIGVLLLMFSIIPVLAGASPTTTVKTYVWIIFFLLAVPFILSLIYCLLDIAQIVFTRKKIKEPRINIEENENTEVKASKEKALNIETQEKPECLKEASNDSLIVDKNGQEEKQEENTADTSIEYEEKKLLFHETYVHADYKNRPVYDMFVKIFDIKSGGKYYMQTMFTALTKSIITHIPNYKDSCYYFGTEHVGSKGNYSIQSNNRTSIPNSDLLYMGKIIDSKLKELETEAQG